MCFSSERIIQNLSTPQVKDTCFTYWIDWIDYLIIALIYESLNVPNILQLISFKYVMPWRHQLHVGNIGYVFWTFFF